jgi:CO dehydrogenase maturation factor
VRIAFVGKGGSGKTTLAALFTRYLAELGRPVLAVDADINQHLGQALGLAEGTTPRSLGADLGWLKDHLRGSNPRLPSADVMIKTSPPGRGSRLARLVEDDAVLRRYAVACGGAQLIVTGEFDAEDIGVSCYHAKTGAVELYLNHLVDGPGEYVVVDMTAGADAFASGLFTRFDLTVLVSEPTQRGIGVYRQYLAHSAGHPVVLRVVGNKATDEADADYLRGQLGPALLATVGHSAWVRAAERGAPQPLSALEPENRAALDTVRAELDGIRRDWAAYHRGTVEFHLRNARAWANRALGRDLADQVDPDFVPGAAFAGSA